MNRMLLTLTLALSAIYGCAGRMNVDLLQARIRQQEAQIAESQLEIAKAKSELKQTRQEAERLKSELAHSNEPDDVEPSPKLIQKVRINPYASGGLNKDDLPGDDVVVVQFAPVDIENQPVKAAGNLQVVLIDPQLPPAEREVGQWNFTADDCLDHWTRGVTGSGFQVSLPMDQSPQHSELVVQLQYTTRDSKRHLASQRVKVKVPPASVAQQRNRQQNKQVQVVDDSNEILPPVGDPKSAGDTEDPSEWDQDQPEAKPLKPGHTVLHSANWTDATIPRLR